MRYVTRAYWLDTDADGDVSVTADEVIESDKTPQRTGLLDQHGDPIYRLQDTVPLGFRIKA